MLGGFAGLFLFVMLHMVSGADENIEGDHATDIGCKVMGVAFLILWGLFFLGGALNG